MSRLLGHPVPGVEGGERLWEKLRKTIEGDLRSEIEDQ
jgi:hypothetical protein